MAEPTTFPAKIKYKDDSFSMADGQFIDKNHIKSKLLNTEDLEHLSHTALDTIMFLEDNQVKNLSAKIVKIDKTEGYLLLDISGNA